MSEKDVKDNETEALNNAAAENADIEAGETDMATSIESVDFAVVYDDGGDSTRNRESAENAENTEGIATEDSVASDNANRVNETLALGATDDEQSLDQHETVQADSATSVSSQIDREIRTSSQEGRILLQSEPDIRARPCDGAQPQNRSQRARRRFPGVPCRRDPRGAGGCRRCRTASGAGGHHGRHDADDQRQRDAQKHEPRRRDTGRRARTPHRFHSAAVRRARRP